MSLATALVNDATLLTLDQRLQRFADRAAPSSDGDE